MKKFLYCLLVFLIIGSAVGGAVLFSNLSYSDNRGGVNTPQNSITATAPDNSDLWTDSGNYATSFAGGDGQSEATAYQISTPEQLARLAYLVNNGSEEYMFSNTYFVQTADIDLSAHYWEAIGTFTSSSNHLEFSGNYDGGGYTISGLYTENGYSSSYSYQGFFGYIRGQSATNKAVIENVGIIDSHVQGYRYIGGVVGYAYYSTITNCYNTGTVSGSGDYVGGVVGYAYIIPPSRTAITPALLRELVVLAEWWDMLIIIPPSQIAIMVETAHFRMGLVILPLTLGRQKIQI